MVGAARTAAKAALFAGVLASGMGIAAAAEKARPVAHYDWTGFYIGANAGAAWGHSDQTSNFTCPVPGSCPYNNPINLAVISAAGTGGVSPTAFTGGGQLGYNYQSGQVVFGGELDIESFRLKGSLVGVGPVLVGGLPAAAFGFGASVDTDWLFTARGRLGWAVQPQLLFYATGGLAVTDLKVGNNFGDNCTVGVCGIPSNGGLSNTSKTLVGYSLGGGLEYALNQNWSVKGEYLYVNFGNASTTLTIAQPAFGLPVSNAMITTAKLNASIARLGLNYRFGGPY